MQVFELLSGLSPPLPGFGRENWQSQIRKFVTVHAKYSDMLPWNGRETSDIVYHDKDRILTELLVEKGHLQREDWLKKTPRYFIEVKCTVGKASTPFYISKAQYRRVSLCGRKRVQETDAFSTADARLRQRVCLTIGFPNRIPDCAGIQYKQVEC